MLNLVKIREELHKIPELGFQEYKTQKFILSILSQFPSLKIHTFEFTGILVEYSHGKDSYRLFRSDMDGLPIKEKTNCSFSSIHEGVMHACGHDIHMTILLGLIEHVCYRKLSKNLLFLFQPAEEGLGGASRILATNILNQFTIDSCYALHVSGKFPVGTIASRQGIFFANTQEVDIEIFGKSAHVAFPENGIDSSWAMELFLTKLRSLVNQKNSNQNNILCYFGKIEAGDVRNAIISYCNLKGTMRAFNEETFIWLEQEIKKIAKKIEARTNAKFDIIYNNFYQSVFNDLLLVKKIAEISVKKGFRFIQSDPELTGEDFGFFSKKYPSVLFWLGAKAESNCEDLHSANFLPSHKSIDIGLTVLKGLS